MSATPRTHFSPVMQGAHRSACGRTQPQTLVTDRLAAVDCQRCRASKAYQQACESTDDQAGSTTVTVTPDQSECWSAAEANGTAVERVSMVAGQRGTYVAGRFLAFAVQPIPTYASKAADRSWAVTEANGQPVDQAPAPFPIPAYATGRTSAAYAVEEADGYPVKQGPYWPGVDCLWQGLCALYVGSSESMAGHCQHCGAVMGPAERAANRALRLAARLAARQAEASLPVQVYNLRTNATGVALGLMPASGFQGHHRVSVDTPTGIQAWAYADTVAAVSERPTEWAPSLLP